MLKETSQTRARGLNADFAGIFCIKVAIAPLIVVDD
jgi:hypothetical protein